MAGKMSDLPIYPDLKGKIALVFGMGQSRIPDPPNAASSSSTTAEEPWGNGAAMTYMLAHNGCVIFGCDIDLSAAQHTSNRIRSALPSSQPITLHRADVTSSPSIQAAVDACVAKHGRIDILVNNVGATSAGEPSTLPEGVWDKQIALNLKSVYLAMRSVLPVMQSQSPPGGAVVTNASIAGIRYLGKPQVAYNAAKAGVMHLTRATAAAWADKGVRLNCIAPGLMYVPLVEKMGRSTDPGERAAYEKITQHNVPMRRMGNAWDVAAACVFLASEKAAGYVTGQTLVVDGGLTVSTGTGFEAKL